MPKKPHFNILGVGNAIMDIVSQVDDQFLLDCGLAKGSMRLVDKNEIDEIYKQIKNPVKMSGGAAANTVFGVLKLGGSGTYIGTVGNDDFGDDFIKDMELAGIKTAIRRSGDKAAGGKTAGGKTAGGKTAGGTGRCLVLVTPDGQRTMLTHLGVAVDIDWSDIKQNIIRSADIVYIEGYVQDCPGGLETINQTINMVRDYRGKVAFSLSDPFCVERWRGEWQGLLRDMNILFGNEAEYLSLYATTDIDVVIKSLSNMELTAVITLSEKGSIIINGGKIHNIAPVPPANLCDSTGAGDLYAAGFLYALARGKNVVAAGRLGSMVASAILSQYGARPAHDLKFLADQII